MTHMKLRKTLSVAVLIGGTMMAASVMAEQPQGTYGHGYGMMGGYDQSPGYGMGPGMMGDYGPQSSVNLSAEQRGKIGRIQEDARRKHRELMGKMEDEQAQMNEQYYADNRDDEAVSKSYRRMSDLRQQMFELSLSTEKQSAAVLTKEQHGKTWRNGYGMWGR